MKTIHLKLLFLISAAVFGINAVRAQAYLEDPRYGRNPEERQKVIELIGYMNDQVNMQEYDQAIGTFNQIRAIKPDVSNAIYQHVTNIYLRKILAAQSVAEKNTYVDSLMTVYNWRIELAGTNPQMFGDKNALQLKKAGDYMDLKPADKAGIRELYVKALEDYGADVPLNDVLVYFEFLVNEYRADRLETDDFMAEYDRIEGIFAASTDPEEGEYKQTFESRFIASGAADCENVERIYRPRIAENPDDIELAQKAFYLLNIGKCNSDFMFELAEKIYRAEPSTQMALYISQAYERKGDTAKSNQYIQEAISTETDPIEKSLLLTQVGSTELNNRNVTRAIASARQAINLDPGNGMAQLLLANAYANSPKGSCSDFDQRASFWIIYDQAARARALLQERGETVLVQSAEGVMAEARANWPLKDDMFLRGVDEGSNYTVNCGVVSGTTRARGR